MNNSCVICLPIYNCSRYLEYIFKNIILISSLFNNFVVIFGYDHCNDNSMELLEKFKINSNLDINIIINNNKRYRYRTHNLAYIRNLMIEMVYDKYENYDFFIMMDSDDVCSSEINLNILKKHIENNENWHSLSFNRTNYYDLWALQYEPFVHHFRCFNDNSWNIIDYVKNDITTKLNNMDTEYFQVLSAFNGFAIYKLDKFVNCKYDGITQKYFDWNDIQKMITHLTNNVKNIRKKINLFITRENCEHIGFHINAIRQNKSIIVITKDILFN